jgi:pimeloyl-ACP methyl ester carboxylesterase
VNDANPGLEPVRHDLQTSGPRLTYFEWGQPDEQPVLLLHATGFHARCWDRVIAELGPGYRVYAVDMRGHGRSERVPPYVWRSFGEDIGELVEHLGLVDAIGVGHSMGGHCLVQVSAARPGAFKRLLLVDPVIFEPDAYPEDRYRGFDSVEDHPVTRRRNDWQDWQEMYERFKGRGSFATWEDAALMDYCRYGVLPKEDGRFELACPPVVESSIYLGNTSTDIYDQIPEVRIPVVVLRAAGRDPTEHAIMDFAKSPTWEAVADAFPNGRDVYLADHTHFMPMQDPALVARYIAEEVPEETGMGSASPV